MQISEWVTGEELGSHKDEEGKILSSGEGLGGFPVADMKSNEEPTYKEESGEYQSFSKRLSDPLVTNTKPEDRVSGSNDHGTVVEAGLSVDREPTHSPVVTD